jgi:hypothetical protein
MVTVGPGSTLHTSHEASTDDEMSNDDSSIVTISVVMSLAPHFLIWDS